MDSSKRQTEGWTARGRLAFAALACACLATLAILAWLMAFSHRGFDFTDEAFYVVWITQPWIYPASVTQFGFLYHPLSEALGGSIVLLRQSNVAITFLLAWLLSACLLLGGSRRPRVYGPLLAVSAILASSSIGFFNYWILYPSYNSLVFQAMLVTATGYILAGRSPSAASLAGWAAIGVGGWLAFMAKPPTAAALAVMTAVYVLAAGKFSLRNAVISVAIAAALTLASALVIDGSLALYVERMRDGIEVGRTLGSGHTVAQLLRIDGFTLRAFDLYALALVTAGTFASICLCASKNRLLVGIGLLAPVAIALLELAVLFQLWLPELRPSRYMGMVMFGVPIGAVAAALVLTRGRLAAARSDWALAGCLLLFPYAFAFGTTSNYWQVATLASFFWMLAGVALLMAFIRQTGSWKPLLPVAMSAQLVAAAVVYAASEAPYRQPQPLRLNDQTARIGNTELILDEGFARYFRELSALAETAGFQAGTPMIDMTGQSPASLYAIRAKLIGQAWTIGGYPGSGKLAIDMLERVPCAEVLGAWLLVEPGGPRSLLPEVLRHFGIDMDRDYEVVGDLLTPVGAGGYADPRAQKILRPNRSLEEIASACGRTESRRRPVPDQG